MWNWVCTLALGAILAGVPGAPMLQAQSTPPPGATVRVTAGGTRFVGTLQEMAGDTVVVKDRRGTLLAIPVPPIERLEVANGRRSTIGLGAAVGAGVGAAAGIVYGAAIKDVLETDEDPTLAFGALGAAAGAAVGAGVGAFIKRTRWETVRVRGLGLSIAI